MVTSSSIIPLRFRIDETYLRDKVIAISSFAYEQACQDFLDSMRQLSSRGHHENPPYHRLNTVLTALAPTLTHPFVKYRNADTGRSERQMLVVGEDVKRRPKAEQISDLLYEWGKQWGYQSFDNEVNGTGRDAHLRLLDSLQQPAQQWSNVDAAFLFLKLDAGTQTGFKAIPSLLSSLLAGKESTINRRIIKWRLIQDGDNGLAVISQPFWAEYQERNPYTHALEFKTGTFAYKLEFHLQTQAGSTHPWIHLYVRCSRYVDSSLTKANWQHDVSVKIGVDQPRLSGWGWSPTLVTLPVAGGKNNPRWDEHLEKLLAAMKARSLIAPDKLFQAPLQYREATALSRHDEYFVLHAEGFKPRHKVKTGFDFAELHEVAHSVSELLGLELSVGKTLTADLPPSFMYLDKLPLSMYDIDDLHRKTFVRKQSQQVVDEAEWQKQNRLERQKVVLQALRRAANNQPIVIYLCWCDTFTEKHLKQELYQALFIEEEDPWPDDITLVIPHKPVPAALLQPLDSGPLDPRSHYQPGVAWKDRQSFKKAWEAQMRQSFSAKTREWESYLSSLLENRSGYGMVLIELLKLDERKYYKDQSIKGAVRKVCNKLGLASQMILPLVPTKKPIPDKKDIMMESQGRERNAVADLLYRQTGLIYERPDNLYRKAGLAQAISAHLHVIGLYKLRKYSPQVHYPMAIRLCPDGTYQALLPQHLHAWLPFMEARKIVGELFSNKKAQDINLSEAELAHFAAQVFTGMSDVPTLVLLEAQGWRNHDVLPQFANGKASLQNQLDLTHIKTFGQMYTPSDLPNLRIIRLRPIGSSGETPQYVPVFKDEEDQLTEDRDFSHLTGFIDTQADSPFFHYLSIGRMPTTAATEQKSRQHRYKLDEGGGIAFKHQTIVEIVPFFLQPGDDAQAWCHVAHFMRVSPGWDGGNTILPYSLHLAKHVLEDQLCILEGALDGGEA